MSLKSCAALHTVNAEKAPASCPIPHLKPISDLISMNVIYTLSNRAIYSYSHEFQSLHPNSFLTTPSSNVHLMEK